MDIDAQIAAIQAAAGDPKRLALTLLDLGPAPPGSDLRRALECAAVPRWFDARILTHLLDPDLLAAADADTWLTRLTALGCVEPLPARGGWNVHETTRLALREGLHAADPARIAALARRAMDAFGADDLAARIEHAYHLVLADPLHAYDRLRPLARDTQDDPADGTALAQALGEYPAHPGWPALTRGWALALRSGKLRHYRSIGETIDDARAALALFEGADAPDADIALTLMLLGFDLARRRRPGDQAEAEGCLGRALALFERDRTRAAHPLRADLDLAEAFLLLANPEAQRGGAAATDAALADYDRGLAIAEPLVAAHPGARWPAWMLSLLLESRGRLFYLRDGRGERPRAEADYRRAIGLREALHAARPESQVAARDLFMVRWRLADLLARGGAEDRATALAQFEQCLADAERLLASDPESALAAGDVSLSLNRIGDLLHQRAGPGDLERALDRYRRGLAIAERLLQANPESGEAARDLYISYDRMALTTEALGDPAALDWWRKAHAHARAMQLAGTLAAADEWFVWASHRAIARLERPDPTGGSAP
jgi:tetratricopeptide (TPR) repeat protein